MQDEDYIYTQLFVNELDVINLVLMTMLLN
jgi:hypothetical protein